MTTKNIFDITRQTQSNLTEETTNYPTWTLLHLQRTHFTTTLIFYEKSKPWKHKNANLFFLISWDAPILVVLFSWAKCYHFWCIPFKDSTLLILPGFSSSKTILVEKIILPFPPNNNAYKIYARNLICYLISRDVVDECQLVSSELMYCSVRKRKILCHRPLGHTNHNSIQSLPITNVLLAW